MKNVLIILSLLTLFSCKKEDSQKKTTNSKTQKTIYKDSITEGFYNFNNNLYKEIDSEKRFVDYDTIKSKMDYCSCEKINLSTKLYKKYNKRGENYYIEVSSLNAYFKKKLIKYQIDFINEFESYKDVTGFEKTYLTELHCVNSYLTLRLNQQNIDEFYVKFMIKNNKLILNKVYIKTHYQDYLNYIKEIDTLITYENKSKITIEDLYNLSEIKPRKTIITDSISYFESLPK